MSDLSDWMEGIRRQGQDMRDKEEKQREELLSQPHEIYTEDGLTYAIWRGINCVSVAQFFNHGDGKYGKLDINTFTQFSFDFLDALDRVRWHGELVSPKAGAKGKEIPHTCILCNFEWRSGKAQDSCPACKISWGALSPETLEALDNWDIAQEDDYGKFYVTSSPDPACRNLAGPFDLEDEAREFIRMVEDKFGRN